MDAQRNPLTPIAFLLLCCMVLYVGGCSRLQLVQHSEVAKGDSNTHMDQYVLGINAYFAKDYGVSAKALLSVTEQTADLVLARKALYGLACAQLMLADTEDAFGIAMKYWQAWLRAAPQNWAGESPLLFDPIVDKYFNVPRERRDIAQQQVGESAEHSITWNDMTLKDELAWMKARLNEAEQQALQRQDTIRALEQENAKLKKQIKAIELIDQKIQEKKTAIPSTE